MQVPVNDRYIIMLNNGARSVTGICRDETIRIMEEANYNSNGRLVAKHIKPLRTLMKGFTATKMSIVSSLHNYSSNN